MIQNQLKLIPLSDIQYTRKARQRTDLTSSSVFTLACSIASNGLLQNIGITLETKEIIFGERRFTAFKLLNMAVTQTSECLLDIGLSEGQVVTLQYFAKNKNNYKDWSMIPVRLVKDTDKLTQDALEFIENVSREELPWQDKAAAAFKIHKAGLAACALRNKDCSEDTPLEHWRDQDTASILGITPSYLNILIKPFRELETAGKAAPQIKEAIKQGRTALSAGTAAKAIKERHGERLTGQSKLKGQPIKPKAEAREEKPEPDYTPILNVDFHEWASTYKDKPFNFVHCDFPYGINYNKGAGMQTNPSTVQTGQYNDDPAIYWDLLQTLATNQEKLIAPSAHMLFWYSSNLHRETEDFFNKHFPSATLQKFSLIWHCSDNLGIVPDAQRYGRRTYETAMVLSFGDRKIVKPVALSVAAPRATLTQRSQKPINVLSHFFRMFVDSSSRVLDPTCGSATSIITAKQLGASSVLGLEIDPSAHEQAIAHWKTTITG